jgi:hypothetical protein
MVTVYGREEEGALVGRLHKACRVDARAIWRWLLLPITGPTTVLVRDRFPAQELVRDATSDVQVCRAVPPYQFAIVIFGFAREV